MLQNLHQDIDKNSQGDLDAGNKRFLAQTFWRAYQDLISPGVLTHTDRQSAYDWFFEPEEEIDDNYITLYHVCAGLELDYETIKKKVQEDYISSKSQRAAKGKNSMAGNRYRSFSGRRKDRSHKETFASYL